MKKMTKREALEKCAAMWYWLAARPGKEKMDALAGLWPEGKDRPLFGCFACEYARQQQGDTPNLDSLCDHCPIWKKGTNCEDEDSPYSIWRGSDDNENRAEAARGVAALARAALAEEGDA